MVFWLLGATDGHAKNFSLRLAPGGRFRLTPLYEITSAQHAAAARQIRLNQFKSAMSAGGNRHYVMGRIQPRHFLQDADATGIPRGTMEAVFAELVAAAPQAIDTVRAAMPPDAPQALIDSIVGGFNERLQTLPV